MRRFTVVIERDSDGWYVATVPALRGCYTQGKSVEQALARIEEAIAAFVDLMVERGEEIPGDASPIVTTVAVA